MAEYVVMVDIHFLGIPVEAENEEDAKAQALNTLDAIAEYAYRSVRVKTLVEMGIEDASESTGI